METSHKSSSTVSSGISDSSAKNAKKDLKVKYELLICLRNPHEWSGHINYLVGRYLKFARK
jgi:hypothetical protein